MLINIVDLTDIVPIVASLSPVLKQIAYQNAANIGAIKYCTNSISIFVHSQCDQMLDFKSCTNVSESCLNNICSSFTLIDIFQKIPKVNNLFGPLLKINLLPRTFKNRPIWSHCPQPWFKVVNLVVLDWHFYEKSERQILGYLTPETGHQTFSILLH